MPPSKEVHVTVRIPREMRDALERMAERGDRTFSHEIRRALRQHVENGTSKR